MGVPVTSFDEFRNKLCNLEGAPALLVFLLYDSRPSQKVVVKFSTDQEAWIDETARAMGTYFCYPNPSPEVSRLFGISLRNLPGILIFAPPTTKEANKVKKAVYLPLQVADFEDPNNVELIFADLCDLVIDALRGVQDGVVDLSNLKEQIEQLRKRQRTSRLEGA